MAVCIKLTALSTVCTSISGGIARIWIFDPSVFDFTQASPVATVAQPYTAVAVIGSDPDAKLFAIKFQKKEAELSFTQSRKGCSSAYEIKLEFKSPKLSQAITTWMQNVDKAGCCCTLGFIIQTYAGTIFVAGEGVVNADPIDVPFEILQNGSTGTTGKLLDDENAATLLFTGSYTRFLYEYTGTVADLVALE